MSVMLLNLGLVLHPDFHPEAFLLAVGSTERVSIVPGVSFPVLEFPGLNVSYEENIKRTLNPYLPLLYDGLEGGDSADSVDSNKTKQESRLHLVVSWAI